MVCMEGPRFAVAEGAFVRSMTGATVLVAVPWRCKWACEPGAASCGLRNDAKDTRYIGWLDSCHMAGLGQAIPEFSKISVPSKYLYSSRKMIRMTKHT